MQFYKAIDDLLGEKWKEKKVNQTRIARVLQGESSGVGSGSQMNGMDYKDMSGKVRTLRKGMVEEKPSSKEMKVRYSEFRRLRKYPPSLLHLCAIFVLMVCIFWIGFGMYGIYTFFQVVYFRQGVSLPNNPLPPNYYGNDRSKNSDEIVIRVVKEVIHVREDGSKIENPDDSFTNGFSQEEIDGVTE